MNEKGYLQNANLAGSACYGHTNLVPAFCRAYYKESGTPLVVVHVAKGSTRIEYWSPGNEGYQILLDKASAAIRKAKELYEVRNIYFVWLQGERDAISSKSREYYKEKLYLLGESLKTELEISRFGIIRVGRFTGDSRDDEILQAQDEICSENPFFLMLTRIATTLNQDPMMMNPYVKGHYSALGLETLGKSAGETLGKNNKING